MPLRRGQRRAAGSATELPVEEAPIGSRHTSIKVSLGRLRPAPEIRSAIERIAARLQVLGVRATHTANEAVLQALLCGAEPPDPSNQSFWYRALTVSACPSSTCSCPYLTRAAEKLFGHEEVVSTARMWPFLASLAQEMTTASVNMIKATFHAQLTKAIKRVLLLWELRRARSGLPALAADASEKERTRLRYEVVRYAERRATQHRNPMEWPEAAPVSLKEALEEHIGPWLATFQSALPCPTPEFIQTKTATKPGNFVTFLR